MNADATSLVPCRGGIRLAGMGTLVAKESAAWWRTRRWWITSLFFLVVLNGTLALNLRVGRPDSAFSSFVMMAAIVLPIAAVSLGQDSLLREKHAGTAAWVLTKPVGREAFVLAKAATLGLWFLLLAVALPGAAAYVQVVGIAGGTLRPAAFAGYLGLAWLHLFFYLSLSLMLAALFDGRGPVLAISLGVLIGWMLVGDAAIQRYAPWLARIMPWNLLMSFGSRPSVAACVLMGGRPPSMLPVAATAAWSLLFLAVALRRFRREEF